MCSGGSVSFSADWMRQRWLGMTATRYPATSGGRTGQAGSPARHCLAGGKEIARHVRCVTRIPYASRSDPRLPAHAPGARAKCAPEKLEETVMIPVLGTRPESALAGGQLQERRIGYPEGESRVVDRSSNG